MSLNPGGNRYEQATWSRNLQAVAAGQVDGARLIKIFARDEDGVPSVQKDMWGDTGDLTLASAGSNWEAVSTSTQDAASGTGAAQIEVPLLDSNYESSVTLVDMDGTTPVLLSTSDNFRLGEFRHCEAGASAVTPKRNQGDISIRPQGGGPAFGVMKATVNTSQTGHYTAPAGKRGLPQFILPNVAKNGDAEISILATTGDDGIFREIYSTSIYQSSVVAPLPVPGLFEPKSDVLIKVTSTNAGTRTTVLFFIVEEDDV